MTFRKFVMRRAMQAIVTVLIAMCINFFLFRIVPGNPFEILIDPRLSPQARADMAERLGLNRPLTEQFVIYLSDTLTGYWGRSLRQSRPVINIILERIPNTLILMIPALIITAAVSLLVGVIAARKRGSKTDVTLTLICLFLSSIPVFWLGGNLLLTFGVIYRVFPLAGIVTPGMPHPNVFSYMGDVLRHLFLPTLSISLVSLGGYFLLIRNSVVDVFAEDYIITATAKGIEPRTILFKHALRNAMLPIVTVVALNFGFLIGGTVLTETIFSWPGMGLMIYEAIMSRDYPVLQASFLILTIFVVAANFAADLLYGYLDPRVKY